MSLRTRPPPLMDRSLRIHQRISEYDGRHLSSSDINPKGLSEDDSGFGIVLRL